MNLRSQLAYDQSKSNIEYIATYINNDAYKFKKLMHIFFSNDDELQIRAAHVMSTCFDKNPEIIIPYIRRLVEMIFRKDIAPALLRNALRCLEYAEIPKEHQSKLLDRCYHLLFDESEAIAVRVFAITVLYNLSKPYSELLNELRTCLEPFTINRSAAIRSRSRRYFNKCNELLVIVKPLISHNTPLARFGNL